MGMTATVESLWRYPVKSMRGEELPEIFVGYSGVYGDRLFAFRSSAAPAGFPFLTGRERHDMLLYRPRFRHPEKAAKPANLVAAQDITPGLNPVVADPADLALDVETPEGEVLAIDDPALLRSIAGKGGEGALSLLRSERAMTDCRPVSLISIQTARQLGAEIGSEIDKRRFRANIYVDFHDAAGFAEDALVGRTLRIGAQVVVAILERDPRCQMISLDPASAQPNPAVLRKVSHAHDGMAGVYGAVLKEGTIRQGDSIEVLT